MMSDKNLYQFFYQTTPVMLQFIERAVILSEGSSSHIDSALMQGHTQSPGSPDSFTPSRRELLKADEIKHLERENILTALNKVNWKISSKNSASELLGMNASALNPRIAKLGIKKS